MQKGSPMRELDLTTLRLFAAVCDARSIARAAEQANIVGSAISKRLAQLEDTVGTQLLVRRRHGVEPTPAGESLLDMLNFDDHIAAIRAGRKSQLHFLV